MTVRRLPARLLCALATRGEHRPSWRAAVATGVTNAPVCATCGTVLRDQAEPA